jgi:hypothetical protein
MENAEKLTIEHLESTDNYIELVEINSNPTINIKNSTNT